MTEIGQVIFFDQKKGWGFINILKSENGYEGQDIFTHFSTIECENTFKKLYPGEYVSLDIFNDDEEKDEKKKLKSKNVKGLFGGKLLVDNESFIYKLIKKRVMED